MVHMTIQRLVEPLSNEDDANEQIIEVTLRPQTFSEYVGQERLKKNLKLAIDAAKKRGESAEAYREVLTRDVQRLREAFQKNGLPDFSVYVYPFGQYSRESPEILRDLGIKAALICDSRVNLLCPGDTEPLMRLKRFNRVPGGFCLNS